MSIVNYPLSTSLAKREIPWAPGFNIDKDGIVRRGNQRIPTTMVRLRNGVELLAVSLEDGERPVAIWKLLSSLWYENKLLLPRNGSAMNWRADNVIVLEKVTAVVDGAILNPDEILYVWVTYCREACSCWQLAEKTGLTAYSRDQFWSLIRDIVVAGIR